MYQTLFRTMAQSSFVSSIFEVKEAKRMGLFASLTTSCQAYLQVSPSVNSAYFMRVGKIDGSGDFVWNVGSGSKALGLGDFCVQFPFLRLETSVAQDNVCSLSLVVKL